HSHRGFAQAWAHSESNGDHRRVARLAESRAHDPGPGAESPRARLRRGGPPLGNEWTRDHRQGADAQPPALSRRDARQFGIVGDPRVRRAGGSRARTDRFPDAGHDPLVGELQRRAHQWLVVVVDRADHDHTRRLSRAVLPHGWAGRDCESAAAEGDLTTDVLSVRNLTLSAQTPPGPVRAADRISFGLRAGERLGFAGESGSGKSTMALAILRMIQPPGRIDGGEVRLDGGDLLSLGGGEMDKGAGDPENDPAAWSHRRWRGPARWGRSSVAWRRGNAARTAGAHRADPPGIDERAESGHARQGSDHRCAPRS